MTGIMLLNCKKERANNTLRGIGQATRKPIFHNRPCPAKLQLWSVTCGGGKMNIIQHLKEEFEKSREALEKANRNDIQQFKGIIKGKQNYFKSLLNFNLTFYLKTMLLHEHPNGLSEADEKDAFTSLNKKLCKKLKIKIDHLDKDPSDNFGIYIEQILCNMNEQTITLNSSEDFFKITTRKLQQIDINNSDNFLKMAEYCKAIDTLYETLLYKVENLRLDTYLAINRIDELGNQAISKSYEIMGYHAARDEICQGKRRNVLAGSRVPQIKETLRELLTKYGYAPERIATLDMRRLKTGFRKDTRKLAESLGLSYRSITNRLREIRNEERKKIKTR